MTTQADQLETGRHAAADEPTESEEVDVEVLDPDKTKIDIDAFMDDMTLGEIEEIEELTGQTIGHVLRQFQRNEFSAKSITAIAYLAMKRIDPDATLDDARGLKFSMIAGDELATGDEDENPKGE